MSALVRLFRHPSRGGSYQPGYSMEVDAATFVEAWSHCSPFGRFRLRDKLIGKLLLKHLIQADAPGGTLAGKSKALTHKELVELNLPDNLHVLPKIKHIHRRKGQLRSVFGCPPLYLTHFAVLARRVLRQNPVALAYTENVDNHPRIKEILAQHQEKHRSNPSLPHLYKLLLGDSYIPGSPEASTSAEEEEPEPAVPKKQKQLTKGTRKAVPASHSRGPKQTAAGSRKRDSSAAEGRLPVSQEATDADQAHSSSSSHSRLK